MILCLGTRQASSQDTKSLTRARYLLFPSTRDGTSISCQELPCFNTNRNTVIIRYLNHSVLYNQLLTSIWDIRLFSTSFPNQCNNIGPHCKYILWFLSMHNSNYSKILWLWKTVILWMQRCHFWELWTVYTTYFQIRANSTKKAFWLEMVGSFLKLASKFQVPSIVNRCPWLKSKVLEWDCEIWIDTSLPFLPSLGNTINPFTSTTRDYTLMRHTVYRLLADLYPKINTRKKSDVPVVIVSQ